MKPTLLKGVRIVDFTTYAAAPAAGRILADWGADVIKVESLDGDPTRVFGLNMGLPIEEDENPIWELENGNKRGIALDLKNPEGMKVMHRLLESADAMITNVRLGSLKKLGLDYETLAAKYPKLVWGHISGYGIYGEEAPRPGFDVVAFWARGGSLIDMPPTGSPPINAPFALGDHTTSLALVSGVLGGVIKAKTTGEGEKIVVSLYNTAIWISSFVAVSAQYGDPFPKSRYAPSSPLSQTYQCKDGEWLTLTVLQYEKQWPILCEIFGMQELTDNPEYNNVVSVRKPENNEYIVRRLEEAFLEKERDEWSKMLTGADIPHEKARHYKDLATDQQALDNNYFSPFTCENGNTFMMPTTPVQFRHNEPLDCDPAPKLGQHNEEVLKEIGYSEEEIRSLRESNAINDK